MNKNNLGNTFLFLFGIYMTFNGFFNFMQDGTLNENSLLYIIPGFLMIGIAFYKIQSVRK
ncbi:MAG: hypothetical protein COU81_01965 [Candidatus Portnoybacteria bacterium CG10_big_fil_rev_8_21_14_0_10_36_7]|uniref:Uncharacterized protein n=1 Tax=Candidatus Portnoybacteria bacterium CG10_big_fil_rev_8_21_14_0_10_36_7 TaxID=1974812 RepID=A0A2M8KE68_9BACT|nr:MAG: hypothetical protein COU81_01965 [Candidatus Portnoybacteria bacterium CG10_big_fil_rev_8_21_14_0_10_36_7]